MEKEQEQKLSKNNEPIENTVENEDTENQKNVETDSEKKKEITPEEKIVELQDLLRKFNN